ncbi:ABC transporter ATP-binding protein [Candidatus Kaiserbacteria bacterium]|nr:ABC transporter ATP-binding protein [Candidatus Kaiserbacteria bacterium]
MQDIWRDDVPHSTNPFKFLVFVSRPYQAVAVISCLLVASGALVYIATAYIFKLIIEAAHILASGGTSSNFWYAIFAYIVISLLSVLFWRGSGFIGMRWATGVRATARYALSSYVMLHSHSYFTDRFAGSISSKITQAANSTKDIAEFILWNLIPFLVSIVGSFALAFYTHPLIAFVFLAWVCVITPLNIYLVRRGVPLSVATQKAETALGGATVDMLTNMNAVHEYARKELELSRLKRFILERRFTGLRNWSFRESIRLANGILQIFFIGGMIVLSAYFTGKGFLSAGDIILILTIILMVEDRLTFIGTQLNNLGDAWGQVVESLTDIVRPYDIADAADARTLEHVRGDISLKEVSFSYGGATVFDRLSLDILAGQKVGLVGRSGAGKSTLVKLLLRHDDPASGTITIDGNDVSSLTKDSLRERIAVVPQEPLLFHRTIRENIAYGKLNANEEQIVHAAKLAEAHEFITQLPQGYDALVGERGVKLSGGQRQRVAIARALLKDAPILLLDEATSSLDSESEVAVQKALLALMSGRTVIAIAHRLSTLRAMDRIIVMDEGHIIEDGTHEELLAKGGLYADLWNHQAGGFLE